jgi:tetratricopeptide (TPR) repeat protein
MRFATITCLAALLLAGLLPGAEELPAIPSAGENEPSVSEEEATLLAQASEQAKTDPAAAARVLRAAETDEGSAALPFAESVYWAEAGKSAEARDALQRTLTKAPRFHRARMNLAKMLIRDSDYAGASRQLRALLGADATDRAEAWRLLAYALQEQGQLQAAEGAYRQAITFFPADRSLRMGLLSCLIEQERFAEAVPLAKRELGREPDKREFWGLLVNAELVTDRREQALNLLECARRLGATDAHMLAVLGDLYLDQSLAEPALACYRQAAALNQAPVSRLLSGFEALILSRHATEAAALGETLARRLEEFTPRQRLRFRSLRASLLASQGKAEAAIREYRLVLEQDPIHGDSLLALGDLLLPAKPQEARELFARAARLDAFQVRAWTALARLAVERNDFARAAEFVQRALARKPDPALERYLAQIRAAMP